MALKVLKGFHLLSVLHCKIILYSSHFQFTRFFCYRYKECDDGICRLQTVRFESLHLSQLMNEGVENPDMLAGDSPLESTESPGTSGGSPETSGPGSPCLSTDQLEEQHFQELLQQYGLSDNSGETQDRRQDNTGPIRGYQRRRATMAHPYERPDSPEIDLPQTLLDLQDAAIRLANGQQAN